MKKNNSYIIISLCVFILIVSILYVGLTSPKKTYSLSCDSGLVEYNNQCCKLGSRTFDNGQARDEHDDIIGALCFPESVAINCDSHNTTAAIKTIIPSSHQSTMVYGKCDGPKEEGDCVTGSWYGNGKYKYKVSYYYDCKNKKVNCSAGKYLPSNSSTCVSCEVGYYCPGGDYYVENASVQGKNQCTDGSTSVVGSSVCTCNDSKKWDSSTNKCIDDEEPQTKTCEKNYYLSNGECVSCGNYATSDGGTVTSCTCQYSGKWMSGTNNGCTANSTNKCNKPEYDDVNDCKTDASSICGANNYTGCNSINANGCFYYSCKDSDTTDKCSFSSINVNVTEGTNNGTYLVSYFNSGSGKTINDYVLSTSSGCTISNNSLYINGVLPSKGESVSCTITAVYRGSVECSTTAKINVVAKSSNSSSNTKKYCCPVNSGTNMGKYYLCDQNDCSCNSANATSLYDNSSCVSLSNCKISGLRSVKGGETAVYTVTPSSGTIQSCSGGSGVKSTSSSKCEIYFTKNTTSTSQALTVTVNKRDGTSESCTEYIYLASSSSGSDCEVTISGRDTLGTDSSDSYSATVKRPSGVTGTTIYKWTASGTGLGSLKNNTLAASRITTNSTNNGKIQLTVDVSFEGDTT